MATLQERHVAIKFQGGIETKMDSKAVPTARLLVLENGVFTKAISIKKRNGYSAYSKIIDGSASLISDAKRLGTRENELLEFTRTRCYSHQSETDQWTDVGAVVCATGTDKPAVATGTAQTMPDHATNDGVSVFAWEDSAGGVWWSVKDASSGTVYRAPAQLDADGQRPRCVAVGVVLHVYWANASTGRVMVMVVNPSEPSASPSSSILVEDLRTSNPVYDVCPTERSGNPAAIAWHENSTTNFRVGYVDQSGVLGSPANGHPSVLRVTATLVATSPIAVAHAYSDGGEGDRLGVVAVGSSTAWTFSGGTSVVEIGTAHTATYAMHTAVSVNRVVAAMTSTDIWAGYEENDSNPSELRVHVNHAVFGAAAGTATIQRSLALVSRAFVVDDEAFAYLTHDTTYFNVYLALRLSDFVCVDRRLAGSAAGRPPRSHVSSAHVDGDVVTTCLSMKERLASTNNDKFGETRLRLLRLDFDDQNSHQTAQLGRGLYMAGGCPQHYDGRVWTEMGFHVGPELISTVTASGGSMASSGVFTYRAWYEYTDAQGEVHRGPVSVGTSVTLGGADTQVTLTLPTLRATKKTNVRICVARSLNGDDSQSFRVTSLDPTTSGAAANGYVANDTTVDTVSFVDRLSDTNLRLQEGLYTNGDVLSNDPTSLGSVIATGKNRLFFSDSNEPNNIRYSQELADGYGVEVAPELVLKTDPFGGDVRAIHVMDQAVVIFKDAAIYAFNGNGPTPTGDISGGAWSHVDKVTSDVGCTNPSSVVETPKGLMFQSRKGIYQIGRDFSVRYVGAPVEAFNGQTITRATVMPDRSQVVFLTADGTTLLYDYLFDQWSTFTNHLGRDAVVVDGTYHYLRLDDRVFAETIDAYSDAGVRIRLRFETAWIHIWEHLQGLQRFWRLLLLGTWGSPHQLGIQYRTDYDESAWGDPLWLDATGEPKGSTGWITGENANPIGEDPITGSDYGDGGYGEGPYGGTNPDVYRWRLGLHCQGESIQFRFEDFEKAGYAGATFELTEMLITGGVQARDNRPGRAARSS